MNSSPTPAVSIVMATFNRAPVLRLALESVRRQTFADWEALVIGDGCTDGSAAIVESLEDPRFRWANLERNTGSQAAANSVGLAMARGRWVAYLGHDDLWFPWHLALLVQTIESGRADFAHPLMAYFTESGFGGCWGVPPEGIAYSELQIPTSGWLHRRELAADVGGWANADTLYLPVDFHLMRCMALAGAKFAFQPRLSLLKFPSWHFPGRYRNEQVPEQTALLRLMILYSEGLEYAILQESAHMLAQLQRQADHQYIAQLLQAADAPESVERFQESRRVVRERRGLAGHDGAWLGAPPAIEAILAGAPNDVPSVGADGDTGIIIGIRCAGATPETFTMLDGTPLSTRVEFAECVTAIVPRALVAQPRTMSLALINRAGTSRPVPYVVPAGAAFHPATAEPLAADSRAQGKKRRKRDKQNKQRR